MNSFFSRSLVLLCGSLALGLPACVGATDAEDAEEAGAEDEVSTVDSEIKATQFLDTNLLKGYLTSTWKKKLATTRDPANGKWYETGADGDSPAGLYGAMSLQPDTNITIDHSKRKYAASSYIAQSVIANNLNGLNPKTKCALSATITSSSETTHTVEDSIGVGVGTTVTGSAKLFGTGASASDSFNIDYKHTWGTSNTKSSGVSSQYSTEITAVVPKGKKYKCILTGVIRSFSAPYTVVARVSGFTETWFSDRVQGHYNHALSGSDAFKLIRDWNLAGADSSHFSSAGLTQYGTLTASTVGSFTTKIIDVTGK